MRITPADAGKTCFQHHFFCLCQDHPRGCGENPAAQKNPRLPMGSPPRMRGKPRTSHTRLQPTGITPADAGKTQRVLEDEMCSKGSPPRMRGKQHPQSQVLCFARITPADAGKTVAALATSAVKKDHPRGCGENGDCTVRAVSAAGSPPRMRGKH